MYVVIDLEIIETGSGNHDFKECTLFRVRKEAVRYQKHLISAFKKKLREDYGNYRDYKIDIDKSSGYDIYNKDQWWYYGDAGFTKIIQILKTELKDR